MTRLNVSHFSTRFHVRKMNIDDAPMIYRMMKVNTQYYEFCGKENVIEDIYNDLEICPPGKDKEDKYYVGFFDENALVAVMDLIDGYPDEQIAYIGFFMVNKAYQGKEIGTAIISEVLEYLKGSHITKARLGYEKENPQSSHFWKKNHFETVREVEQGGCLIVVAERSL